MSTSRRKKRSRNEMEEDELQALQEAVQAHWPQMDKSDELDREKDMQWYNELKDRRWENTNILRRVLVGTFQPSDDSEEQQVWAWRNKNDLAMLAWVNGKVWRIVLWDQVKFSVSRAEWEAQITQKKKIAEALEMMERSNTLDKKITKIEADLLFKSKNGLKAGKVVATMAGYQIEKGYNVPEIMLSTIQNGKALLAELRKKRAQLGKDLLSAEAVSMAAMYLITCNDQLPCWFRENKGAYQDEFIQRYYDYVVEPTAEAPSFLTLNEDKIREFYPHLRIPIYSFTKEDFDQCNELAGYTEPVLGTIEKLRQLAYCSYIARESFADIMAGHFEFSDLR